MSVKKDQRFFLGLFLAGLFVGFACKPKDGSSDSASMATTDAAKDVLQVKPWTPSMPGADLINKEIAAKNSQIFSGQAQGSSATVIIDPTALADRVTLWHQTLPEVVPHFAVKANPHPAIVRALCAQGINFDTASLQEMQTVERECWSCCQLGESQQCCPKDMSKAQLGYGDRCVFANPQKLRSEIRAMLERGVTRMTFDDVNELKKMSEVEAQARQAHPDIQPIGAILRVSADTGATYDFGKKYGVSLKEAQAIVDAAKAMKANLIGVSFHAGTNTLNESVTDAVRQTTVQKIINGYSLNFKLGEDVLMLMKNGGFNPTTLDWGGGFVGANDAAHRDIAAGLWTYIKGRQQANPALYKGLSHISEPGRYFPTKASTILVPIARYKAGEDGKPNRTYIQGGVYDMFHEVLVDDYSRFDWQWYLSGASGKSAPTPVVSVVFGNSCDSMDKLPGQFALPATPQEGDWLVVRSFGGYGGTFYTGFNGLPKQQFLVVQKGALVPWESIPHVTPEPAY